MIKKISKKSAISFLEKFKVRNRMSQEMMIALTLSGWQIDDYSMERVFRGYPIVIEFCIGDYCVYICSKKGHWLLEKKQSVETFDEAIEKVIQYEVRIEKGEHWTGEEN